MAEQFSSGKHSIAECDRCGFRFKLKQLQALVIKTKQVNILVCPECYEADHPQLQLGMYPVSDPQAVRNPRRDNSYRQSGVTAIGTIGSGSRTTQWGWAPVGGARLTMAGLVPNYLVTVAQVGNVTVT